MGVGKRNIEVVSIDHLFLIFFMNTPPGEYTAAAISALSLKIDLDSRLVPHATLEMFSPILALVLLV